MGTVPPSPLEWLEFWQILKEAEGPVNSDPSHVMALPGLLFVLRDAFASTKPRTVAQFPGQIFSN